MINEFRNENAFLSNFFILENPTKVGFLVFKTNEHFYQAHKTLNLNDRVWITDQPTPALARKAGSKKGLNGRKIQLREDWSSNNNNVMWSVMYTGLVLKFMNNYNLAAQLVSTWPKKLIEGNSWHDNFWGDCLCYRCAHIEGKNTLGLMLMHFRDKLITLKI